MRVLTPMGGSRGSVDAFVVIPHDMRRRNLSIQSSFEEANPDLSDRQAFLTAIMNRPKEDATSVDS